MNIRRLTYFNSITVQTLKCTRNSCLQQDNVTDMDLYKHSLRFVTAEQKEIEIIS